MLASPELYQDEEQSVVVIQEYRELKGELLHKYDLWEELADEQEGG